MSTEENLSSEEAQARIDKLTAETALLDLKIAASKLERDKSVQATNRFWLKPAIQGVVGGLALAVSALIFLPHIKTVAEKKSDIAALDAQIAALDAQKVQMENLLLQQNLRRKEIQLGEKEGELQSKEVELNAAKSNHVSEIEVLKLSTKKFKEKSEARLIRLREELNRAENENKLLTQNSEVDRKRLEESKRRISNLKSEVEISQAQAISAKKSADRVELQLEKFKGPDEFRDEMKSGNRGPEMVVIPGSTFNMGAPESDELADKSEKPPHIVSIQSFAISKYEITFEEYILYANASGQPIPADAGWGLGNLPVINVDWEDADNYTKWLSKETGRNYRLPTEAEWEYVARGNTSSAYYWGDEASHDHANFGNDNSEGVVVGRDTWKFTAPVGSFDPNPFQIYDISGNVAEWIQDCWHEDYSGGPPSDGSAWGLQNGGDCNKKLTRGGGWYNPAEYIRSSDRNFSYNNNKQTHIGIRIARDL